MPWTCRLISLLEIHHENKCKCADPACERNYRWTSRVDHATLQKPVAGDMYFAPWYLEQYRESLAPYYCAHNADRAPVVVVLPNGDPFCVDSRTTMDGELGPEGWQVSGVPPLLTVTPSINCVGRYHGYLTNGVLSNDVDGRVFP